MSKLKTLVLACAAALAMPTIAAADPGPGDNTAKKTSRMSLGEAEKDELMHRHHVNVMEIEMAKLAQKRGGPEVKKFAAMLLADHQKADKDVRALAKTRSVTLADKPMDDDEDAGDHAQNMALMDRLRGLEGAAFDREFIAAMIDGHTKELARVDTAMPLTSDEQVRFMLDKTQPSLSKHLDRARAIQTKIGGASSTGTDVRGTGTGPDVRGTGTGTTGTGTGTGTTGTMRGTGTTGTGTGTTGTMRGTGTTGTGTGTGTTGTGTYDNRQGTQGPDAGTGSRTGTRRGTDSPKPGTTTPGTGTSGTTGTGTTRRPLPTAPDSIPPSSEPIDDQPIGPTPPGQ